MIISNEKIKKLEIIEGKVLTARNAWYRHPSQGRSVPVYTELLQQQGLNEEMLKFLAESKEGYTMDRDLYLMGKIHLENGR